MSGLMTHAGSFEAVIEDVIAVPVPIPTATQSRWNPVPYKSFLDCISEACGTAKVPVAWDKARYALAREGQQMFGVAPINYQTSADAKELQALGLTQDWSPMIGFRQSYDQSIAAGMVLGHNVFVCDNLAFCGEFQISAKNTLEVMEVLPNRLLEGASKIIDWTQGIVGEVKLMKAIRPSEWEIDNILVQSVRKGVLPGSKMGQLISEIDSPTYDYDQGHNGGPSLWGVFNACTTVQRDRSPITQFRTGGRLLDLFREHGLRERRVELTDRQRRALEDMERETAEVLRQN